MSRSYKNVMNPVRVEGDVAFLCIAKPTRGFVGEAMVDVTDLERLFAYGRHWTVLWNRTQFYAAASEKINGKWQTVLLHRFLTNAPDGMDVDHVNHTMLDCRRANLRVCTRAENMQNRRGAPRNSSSGVRGVSYNKNSKSWGASGMLHGKRVLCKYFRTKEEAISAAVEWRKRMMPFSKEARECA